VERSKLVEQIIMKQCWCLPIGIQRKESLGQTVSIKLASNSTMEIGKISTIK